MGDKKKYTKKEKPVSELLNIGKLPPQAIDLEEAIIGALMLESKCIIEIIDFLPDDAFYKDEHKDIYHAIKYLFNNSKAVDILTVTNELKRTEKLQNVGGAYYITQLTNRIASSAHIVFHARIVLQKFIQRELIRISQDNITKGYEDSTDVFELIDESYTSLNNITNKIIKSPAKGSSVLLTAFMKQLEIVAKTDNAITGVPTTLEGLNRVTRGFQKSDLILIAARPSMGKSSSIKNIINGAINRWQRPVLLFSLEMSAHQQISRLISEDVGVSSQAFNSKEFLQHENSQFDKIHKASSRYFDKNNNDLLIIDDDSSLSINELKARAKRVASENDICCIMVDYIQKVSGSNNNRALEVEEVTWGLKSLAKELDIPIIALSQLNRKVEERKPPRPILSDLRDSGAIEQDADQVIFLFRPEYYGIEEIEDGSSSNGYAEWIIAKNRNGELSTVKTRFIPHLTQFIDWENQSTNVPLQQVYNANVGIKPNTDFYKDEEPF